MNAASKTPTSPPRRRPKTPAERRKGWFAIAFVAIFTLLFFVLGTMDPSTRYDLIGL